MSPLEWYVMLHESWGIEVPPRPRVPKSDHAWECLEYGLYMEAREFHRAHTRRTDTADLSRQRRAFNYLIMNSGIWPY
jgi:hypothetical protein